MVARDKRAEVTGDGRKYVSTSRFIPPGAGDDTMFTVRVKGKEHADWNKCCTLCCRRASPSPLSLFLLGGRSSVGYWSTGRLAAQPEPLRRVGVNTGVETTPARSCCINQFPGRNASKVIFCEQDSVKASRDTDGMNTNKYFNKSLFHRMLFHIQRVKVKHATCGKKIIFFYIAHLIHELDSMCFTRKTRLTRKWRNRKRIQTYKVKSS